MPRLELVAAVSAVNVCEMADDELQIVNLEHRFWCDSKIVLGNIANETRRFILFIANRVHRIRSYSKPDQWSYVPTEQNPADCATRGISMEDKRRVKLWINGPEFLKRQILPVNDETYVMVPDDPEIKPNNDMKVNLVLKDDDIVEGRAIRISDWSKIKRVMTYVLRYINACKSRQLGDRNLSVSETETAELTIICTVQPVRFAEDIASLALEQKTML